MEFARELVVANRGTIGATLADELLAADQSTDAGIAAQRTRVAELKKKLDGRTEPWAVQLASLADILVKRCVWIVGGDGWAYDIGYGGLDHVLASGRNVNVLVLDTQVYSNTGGQSSKATPRAAVAKFAAAGKQLPKKDLGMIAMTYGNIYVAQVANGASDVQTLKAFIEAEAYDGPSLIIAYSHCAQQGFDLSLGLGQQKLAVDSGAWPLYRYNPTLTSAGKNPLTLDSKGPKIPLREYVYNETRYSMLARSDEARAEMLLKLAQQDVENRWQQYEQWRQPLTTNRPISEWREDERQSWLRPPAVPYTHPQKDVSDGRPLYELHGPGPQESHRPFCFAALQKPEHDQADGRCRRSRDHHVFALRGANHHGSAGQHYFIEHWAETSAEAQGYYPQAADYNRGPDQYLELIYDAKAAVDVPVIGSLNGVSTGGWIDYAKKIEQAGADALELNVYMLPTQATVDGTAIEQVYVDILRAVKSNVRHPSRHETEPVF